MEAQHVNTSSKGHKPPFRFEEKHLKTAITATSSAVFINSQPPRAVRPLAEPGAQPATILFHFSPRLQRKEAFSPPAAASQPHTSTNSALYLRFMYLQADVNSEKLISGPCWALCACFLSSLYAQLRRATFAPRGSQPARLITLFVRAVLATVAGLCLLFPVPPSASCCLLCME